ncbi:glycosyltransferase family 4 protein [Acidobacteriota bacterium]
MAIVDIRAYLSRHPLLFRLCRFLYRGLLPVPVFFLITLPLMIVAVGVRLVVVPFCRNSTNRKRRVIMVVPTFDRIGGYENQARSLTTYLVSMGDDVVVVTDKPAQSSEILSVKAYPVFRLGHLPSHPRHLVTSFNRLLWFFLWRPGARVVHIQAIFSRISFASALAAKLMGKRTIAKIPTEGDIIECLSHPEFEYRSYFHTIRFVDRIVALSDRIKSECIRNGMENKKILIIFNGVDTEAYSPAKTVLKNRLQSEFGFQEGKTVLYTGRFVQRKGLDFLLMHFKVIAEKTGARLVLAGDGPIRAELERLAASQGIKDSVIFTGMVKEIPKYIQAADLFVFPSRREGVPNAVLEAMSAGLPVIATRIGGIEDIIESGRNGILIEPDNGEELLKAACTLLADDAKAKIMGEEARRFILHHCSFEVIGQRYRSLYDALAE